MALSRAVLAGFCLLAVFCVCTEGLRLTSRSRQKLQCGNEGKGVPEKKCLDDYGCAFCGSNVGNATACVKLWDQKLSASQDAKQEFSWCIGALGVVYGRRGPVDHLGGADGGGATGSEGAGAGSGSGSGHGSGSGSGGGSPGSTSAITLPDVRDLKLNVQGFREAFSKVREATERMNRAYDELDSVQAAVADLSAAASSTNEATSEGATICESIVKKHTRAADHEASALASLGPDVKLSVENAKTVIDSVVSAYDETKHHLDEMRDELSTLSKQREREMAEQTSELNSVQDHLRQSAAALQNCKSAAGADLNNKILEFSNLVHGWNPKVFQTPYIDLNGAKAAYQHADEALKAKYAELQQQLAEEHNLQRQVVRENFEAAQNDMTYARLSATSAFSDSAMTRAREALTAGVEGASLLQTAVSVMKSSGAADVRERAEEQTPEWLQDVSSPPAVKNQQVMSKDELRSAEVDAENGLAHMVAALKVAIEDTDLMYQRASNIGLHPAVAKRLKVGIEVAAQRSNKNKEKMDTYLKTIDDAQSLMALSLDSLASITSSFEELVMKIFALVPRPSNGDPDVEQHTGPTVVQAEVESYQRELAAVLDGLQECSEFTSKTEGLSQLLDSASRSMAARIQQDKNAVDQIVQFKTYLEQKKTVAEEHTRAATAESERVKASLERTAAKRVGSNASVLAGFLAPFDQQH
eukprot:GFYU01003613.1.p1 GENE.GFYU01003613.1~~GFYU01003613.1.p1  ORF type:complete len:699 (-),score=232.99 GFYU01003613.1:155-2251(-)